MQLLTNAINFFRLNKTKREFVNNEILTENLLRNRYLTFIFIPFDILFLVQSKLSPANIFGNFLSSGIIIEYLNLLSKLIFIVITLIITWFSYRPPKNRKLISTWFNLLLLLLLLGGSVIFAKVENTTSILNVYLITYLVLFLVIFF